MTKKDKIYFLKECIIDYIFDSDKFEDVEYYFDKYFNKKLTDSDRWILKEFSINVYNLWYYNKNFWHAEYIARRKLNKLINFILTYNK